MDQRPALFLVPDCGAGVYKSGRSLKRGTPDTPSTSTTLSAGTRPRAIHPEMEPCDLSFSARANAVWPPTLSHASRKASSLMGAINAQTVIGINARSGNGVSQTPRMGRQAETEASEFWLRLVEAWSKKGLPTSQNGVATTLDMSQGSTRRWHTGDGLPEMDVLVQIAQKGDVTVDWLLTGRYPKHPIKPDTPLGRIHNAWNQIDDTGRIFIAETVEGRAALMGQKEAEATKKPGKQRS